MQTVKGLKVIRFVWLVGMCGFAVLALAGWTLSSSQMIGHSPELVESLPLIQVDEAHRLGFTGEGVGVAIIDIYDPNPNDPCKSTHGLWIEGLVQGVAPDAEIKRFAINTVPSQAGSKACYIMDSAEIKLALQNILDHHEEWNIQVVNLSWGGGHHKRICGGERDLVSVLIRELNAEGITVVAASGNAGWTDAMLWPACMPETISVSASFDYDGDYLEQTTLCAQTPIIDTMTCYGNSASFLDVVAPGSRASVHSGLSGLGTSASTAYVSGVIALLLQSKPGLPSNEVRHYLADTGETIKDHRNGLSFPRINALNAIQAATELEETLNPAPTNSIQKGDLNQDNILNQSDYLILLYALGGIKSLDDTQRDLADVMAPCDATPNWADYYRLKDIVAGNAESQCDTSDDLEPASAPTPLQITTHAAYQTSNALTFTLNGFGISSAQVMVYDLNGRMLLSNALNPGQSMRWTLDSTDGSQIANGVYLVVWDIRGDNQHRRIIQKIAVIR
jgi:hypothetical protein